MRGVKCSVCSHVNRASIDRQLVAGVPVRTLASEYGLSSASVGRHKLKCAGLPHPTHEEKTEATRATVALAMLPSREELGGVLQNLANRLDVIAQRAESDGAAALSITALDKLRLSVESMSRLAGFSGGGKATEINVVTNIAISPDQIANAFAERLGAANTKPIVIEGLLND
jgi:hypothetical protein